MHQKAQNHFDLGAAIAGDPPAPIRKSAWQLLQQLAPEILAAKKRGWQNDQIANALNAKFCEHDLPQIDRSTIRTYLSKINTLHRTGAFQTSNI